MKISRDERRNEVIVNDATVLSSTYRNFGGEKRISFDGRVVNDAGSRNFCMAIDPDFIPFFEGEGVTVKYMKKRDDDDDRSVPAAYVQVKVRYGSRRDPDIYKITKKGKRKLRENELGKELDRAYFSKVDLNINIYHSGAGNATLYLQQGYFTIKLDPLTEMYEDLPEIGEDEEENPFE